MLTRLALSATVKKDLSSIPSSWRGMFFVEFAFSPAIFELSSQYNDNDTGLQRVPGIIFQRG